jgi:hypothetical protein
MKTIQIDTCQVNQDFVKCNQKKLLWDLELIVENPEPLLFITMQNKTFQLNIKKYFEQVKNENSN